MENDRSEDDRGHASAPNDPAAARAALNGLDADGAALAARVVTPPWYHPLVGGFVAAFVMSTALPGAYSTIVVALAVVGLVLVMIGYQRHYGVGVSQPAGPRSRRMLAALVAVMIVCMLGALVIKLTGADPWWAAVPAAAGFVLTVVLGRAYDAVLRGELAQNGSART